MVDRDFDFSSGAINYLEKGEEVKVIRSPSPAKPLRIAVTTAYGYWGDISPDDILSPGGNKMLGGGETAMIFLSTALARAGHRVDLFYDTARPGTFGGVSYLGKALKVPMLCSVDYDLLISWEDYEALEINHRARKTILAVQCNNLQLLTRTLGVDVVQVVSDWHAGTLMATEAAAPLLKQVPFMVIPNGVDLRRYDPARLPASEIHQRHRVIHSSSPDRGLHHLLNIWPRVKHKVPDATLQVFYDMDKWFRIIDNQTAAGFRGNTFDRSQQVKEGIERCKGLGLTLHGGVGQWNLALEQMRASLMVYPCDPVQPTEGFSISILEALAAGTPVITTDVDALKELWGGCTQQLSHPVDEDDLYEAVVEALRGEGGEDWLAASEEGKEVAARLRWENIGKVYASSIEGIAG